MDPLAHTLVGATMAEAGLKRLTPLAVPAALVGANLPDIDGVAGLLGRDASLYWRRGHTHGVVAMALLPLLLAAGLWLWARWRPPREGPVRFGGLLLVSAVAVWSHPLLDWMNTYGVRLLMPFSGRWFYGDAVFIVDPWMWLLAASAVVLARSRGRPGKLAWAILAMATTALVVGSARTPLAAKVVWGLGVAGLLLARLRRGPTSDAPRVATAALVCLSLYLVASIEGSALARDRARAELARRGHPAEALMVGPVAARPLLREGVARTAERWRFFEVDLAGEMRLLDDYPADPALTEADAAAVEEARRSPEVRGFVNWARFPHYSVSRREGRVRVWLRDLRYATPDQGAGFGVTFLDLPRDRR